MMAWTQEQERKLTAARGEVERLERQRDAAIAYLQRVLVDAGLLPEGADIALIGAAALKHADAIRDALLPFDSGVRCQEAAKPTAPQPWPG